MDEMWLIKALGGRKNPQRRLVVYLYECKIYLERFFSEELDMRE